MIYLIVLMFRLSIKLFVVAVVGSIWLMWAMIALPMMLVASARGNRQSVHHWERSMRWRLPHVL